MPIETNLIEGWTFREGAPDDPTSPLEGTQVELPHNAVDLPLNYFDEGRYQREFTYQRRLSWHPEWEGQEIALRFDGAMADAVVWLNGVEVARHADGYTPFVARLTPELKRGENILTVRLSGAENPEIPPFGGRIDYLTYAGIYREVWLVVAPSVAVGAVKVETPDPLAEAKRVTARVEIAAPDAAPAGTLCAWIVAPDGTRIAEQTVEIAGDTVDLCFDDLRDIALWTPDNPALYRLELELTSSAGTDRREVRFGVRHAEFTAEGFRLNGQPLKLMGLNRHQSFPYSGYAQGRRSQERDAEILKTELGCNLARTSHYPQSPWFLDRCDEIGLLVFEEIPGWQHIGGEAWKAESVRNTERMIRRDWNHPSIVLWGVRINESRDDHDFFAETNRVARALDPTRQTGGVRKDVESELLEDVYTMNDFVLGSHEAPGSNRPRTPLRPVTETTGLADPVPYMVTEYNGHMFPTKAVDPELRQAEHVIRHLDVLDAMYGDPGIAGAIGWCFFDYNTHKDFGSGDRICHHGVSTIFRVPKFAGHAYASQMDPKARTVMEPVTFWARGERNIGGVLPLIVLTNCDEVELSYGDAVVRVGPDRERFPNLPHPPVIIGQHHFAPGELDKWGETWRDGLIVGYRGGREVARRRYAADPVPDRLEVAPDQTTLDAATREETRVVLRGLDQADNVLPFLAEEVSLSVEGPARLIGPECVTLQGGTAGLWLRASGETGAVRITARTIRFGEETVMLSVT